MDRKINDLDKTAYKYKRESIRFAPMVSKIYLKSAEQQRDQYKTELHHCKAEIESHQTNLKQHKEALKYTRDEVKKYKSERDTLIDDLSWYKAKVSRLEQIIERKEGAFKGASNKIKRLEHENKDLSIQFNEYIDETYEYLKLLSEISQHIGRKPSSSTYKYFRAKLDGLNIEEDE